MFSWQRKKLPQRQREPFLAPTRRMRFKISLLSTMNIFKKKPVMVVQQTLQALKDGVVSLPTTMKSSSSTPTQQPIKEPCGLSSTNKTPVHDEKQVMQESTNSSKPIATTDKVDTSPDSGVSSSSTPILQPLTESPSVALTTCTPTNGRGNNIDELTSSVSNTPNITPASSLSLLLTPTAQRQSKSPELPSAFSTPTNSNGKKLLTDDSAIGQLSSLTFNNTCFTPSPNMLMWPFKELSSNTKEQAVEIHSSPLPVSSPILGKQDSLNLFESESPFFVKVLPTIKEQNSKRSASTETSSFTSSNKTDAASSPTEISANNEEKTVKTPAPNQHTLSSPNASNSSPMVNSISSPTPKSEHQARSSALWPAGEDSSVKTDENSQVATSNKFNLLSFSDKKINTTSNPRTPLSSLTPANTKKHFANEALVANNSTQLSNFKKVHAASSPNMPLLVSKNAAPTKKIRTAEKTTFKAPAPISKRKRNQKNSRSNNGGLNNDKVCIEPPPTTLSLVVINHIFIRYHRPITSRTTSTKVKQYQSMKDQQRETRSFPHWVIYHKRLLPTLHHYYSVRPCLNRQQRRMPMVFIVHLASNARLAALMIVESLHF
jgi:hypothetical protein